MGLLVIVVANLVGIGVASYNLMTVAEAAEQVPTTVGGRLQHVPVDISLETADMISADLQQLIDTAIAPLILEGEIYLDETIILADGQSVTIGGDFVLSAGELETAFRLEPESTLNITGGLFDGGYGLGFLLDDATLNISAGHFQGFEGGLVEMWNGLLNLRGGGFVANGSPATNGGVVAAYGSSDINISGDPVFQGNIGHDGGVVHLADDSSLIMSGGQMLDNTAFRGGGIFADGLDTLRMIDIIGGHTGLNPMFGGNSASTGTLYHLPMGLDTLHATAIHNDQWSGGMPHGFNNNDVNQPGDDFALQFVPSDEGVRHPDAFPMEDLGIPLGELGFALPAGEEMGSVPAFAEALSALPNPERAGFEFAGWVAGMPDGEQVDFEDLPPDTPMPEENLAFYARWEPIDFPITFNFDLTPEQEEAFGDLLEEADLPESFNPNQLPMEIELPWLYDWAVDGMEMATPEGEESLDVPEDAPNSAQIPPTLDDQPTAGPLEITPSFVPLDETTPPPPPQDSPPSPSDDEDDEGDNGDDFQNPDDENDNPPPDDDGDDDDGSGNGDGRGSGGGNGGGDGNGNGGSGGGGGSGNTSDNPNQNPLTGDNFALAGLIFSIVGLTASSVLTFLLILNRKIKGDAEEST